MLNKLLHARALTPSVLQHAPAKPSRSEGEDRPPSAARAAVLKIVRAGGFVDSYYMAVQAATIIEKHPSFLLARPEVFLRPWESVVRPEEILVPGEKYYIIPWRTIRKLRRRIPQRPGDFPGYSVGGRSFSDMSECGMASDCFTSGSMPAQVCHHRVVKAGSNIEQTRGGGSARKREEVAKGGARAPNARKMVAWQPELTAISEASAVY